jgi:short-subunit dehydrogenase
MAQPGSGYYTATKFAVEGLSDALRREIDAWEETAIGAEYPTT